jgi:8-amino-7-oxononanoate synthase
MTFPGDRFALLRAGLEARSEAARLRRVEQYVPVPGSPHVLHDGCRLLSFCSNDYLGLATDRDVAAAAARVALSHGTGSGASRLVVGGFDVHAELEADLADFTEREAALLFSSGFQANASVIPAMTRQGGLVVCDGDAHASILAGCRLSRADFERFRHNDVEHLNALLDARSGDDSGPQLIVTESLFSMDGDRAPLDEIAAVAERHGALLMVDDAHAIGVCGERGQGLAVAHRRIDLLLGTFGKAFGTSGAFVASSDLLRSHLVNFCPGVIYSTAPAPPVVGAAAAALEAVRSGMIDLARFRGVVEYAHQRLRDTGFDTDPSDSHIVPICLGDDRTALACEAFLRSRGILAVAIRPPTVPEGTARLRISLTTRHTRQHVDELVGALTDYRAEEGS